MSNGDDNDNNFDPSKLDLANYLPPPIDASSPDYINLAPDPNRRHLDDIMEEMFEAHGMERLGGASGRGWSSHAKFQRCPMLFKLSILDQVRPPPSAALETGSAMHTFLALHYLWMLREDLTLTPYVARDGMLDGGGDAKAILEAWRVYEAYLYKYEVDYLTPIAMEERAEDPDGNTCRYDLIAEVHDAHPGIVPGIYNVEHKSAARFTADVIDGWRNDGEIFGQMMIWKRAGLDKKYGELRGTIVNICGKQKKPQFHRTIVPAQWWQVEQHMADLRMSSALQQMYAATGVWPRFRANCVHRYGMCSYFDLCAENREPVDANPREFVPIQQLGISRRQKTIAVATESQLGLASDATIEQMSSSDPHDASNVVTSVATAIDDSTDI